MTTFSFFIAGLALGISFLGGYFLYAGPLSIVFFLFGLLNKPQAHSLKAEKEEEPQEEKHSPTSKFKIIEDDKLIQSSNLYKKFKHMLHVDTENEVNVVLFEAITALSNLLPGSNSVVVFFPGKKDRTLVLRSYISESKAIQSDVVIHYNQGLIGRLLNDNIHKILEGEISSRHSVDYYKEDEGINSVAGVPIMAKGNRSGALIVDSKEANFFEPEIIDTLNNYANFIGSMVFYTYMTSEYYYQREQISFLYKVQENFLSKPNLAEINKEILSYIKNAFPWDRIMILGMQNEQLLEGIVYEVEGIDAEFFANQEFNVNGKGILPLVFLKKAAINQRFNPEIPTARIAPNEIIDKDIKCLIAAPVFGEEEQVRMVISIESKELKRYSAHQLELLKEISKATSRALSNLDEAKRKISLSQRDQRTGLYKHNAFQEKLRQECIKGSKINAKMGMLLVEITNLKMIQEKHGELGKNEALKVVARTLKESLRKEDIIGHQDENDLIALLSDIRQEQLDKLSEKIRLGMKDKEVQLETGATEVLEIEIGHSFFPASSAHNTNPTSKAYQSLNTSKAKTESQTASTL